MKSEVDSARIFTTDLNGRLRTVHVNSKNMKKIMKKGVGFDASSISGIATVDNSDKLLLPIKETFRVLSFRGDKFEFYIGKINDTQDVRSKVDPRAVLEKILGKARNHRFLAGPEHEFFLLSSKEFGDNIHSDIAGYFHADPMDRGAVVRKRIINILSKCGIKFEKTHHEVAPSQHEINLAATNPLEAADRTLLVNYVTKRVAREYGYYATFMPKPFNGENRNAFHIHLSMKNKNRKNIFYDKNEKYNLSKVTRQFIGGILKYARETSIIMASTFNSYKAYVIEKEAPITIGWGLKNRSSMVRIPYYAAADNMRIELRNPDPAGNVYLQLATLIGMGLQGIKEKLDCGQPDIGSTYKKRHSKVFDNRFLPKSMFEALMEAEQSKFLRNLLGKQLYKNYMVLKMAEWEEHRTYVTQKEHKKYLSV